MNEQLLRESIVQWGASIFARGLTSGSSGNISVRLDAGYLTTPTNSCLGFLDVTRLSRLDERGVHVSGDKPTKEWPLHRAFYDNRPGVSAVVHLHSTYATALSCLADVDPENAIPPLTPYVVMKVGKLPTVPYARPGAPEIAVPVGKLAPAHAAVLICSHGPVVSGGSLDEAVYASEEVEEAARLAFITRGMPVRTLSTGDLAELERVFRKS